MSCWVESCSVVMVVFTFVVEVNTYRYSEKQAGMSKKKTYENTTFQKKTPTHPYARTPRHQHTHTNTDIFSRDDTTAPMHTPRHARTGTLTHARTRTPAHPVRPRAPTSGGWFSFLCCSGFGFLLMGTVYVVVLSFLIFFQKKNVVF